MDLSYLRPLYDHPGPWVSVYLDATRAEENAEHQVELRWRALRADLESQGADAATLDAVAAAVQDHPYQPGRYGVAVFATEGEVALFETLPAPPATDEAAYGPLPHAMPLVAQRGEEIPYVTVLSDRTGADVTGLAVGGVPRHREVKGGESFPLRKVNAGGWSHRRYQQAAEETWKRNAGDVAAAATELAQAVGAEVIVVGGDARTNPLVAERLPLRWRERVVVTDAGTRHRDGEEHFDDMTVQAIAEVADRHVRDAVDRYNAQRGDGTAGTGLADVVTRLQRGQADTVLLVNDASSTDELWIGPGDPSLVAVDQQELRESGINDPRKVRADAALLRAIVGTDAELVLVGPGDVELEHGIGAILRYADGASAAS
ncbi:Vms1/Ankzf1 family peptidyl-tRNA hydrolase [Actinoplanes sp. NPDC049548]|uniref:baeRF2 domain-containing protein n=1 Tax=Actinoplanes sp. NPDC049548 TaxID=3155152 RepID=UPI003416AD19